MFMTYQKDKLRKKTFLSSQLIDNILVVKNKKNSYFFDPDSLIVFSKVTDKNKNEKIISEYKKNQKIPFDIKKKKKEKKILDFSNIKLELHVINDCNLRCKYCYVDSNINKDNKKQMSKEVIEKAFRFALKSSPKVKTINISLFGGEPMLFWKEFTFLIAKAKEIFKGKKIRIGFSTNGTIVNDKILKLLKENNISFQLSLDGPQKLQDFLRPTAQKKGSFSVIDKNISHFQDIQKALTTRVTITPYNMNLSELFSFFKKKGFKKINFWPCSSEIDDLIIKEENLLDLFYEWEKFAKLYLKHLIEDDKIIHISQFHNFLNALHFGHKKESFCGVGKNIVSVSIDGGIYLCHRFVDNKSYKIGDLDSGIMDTKKSFLNNSIENEKCNNCFAKYVCGGGCAHERSVSFLETSCQITRYILSLSIWMYGELASKNPEVFEKLFKKVKTSK